MGRASATQRRRVFGHRTDGRDAVRQPMHPFDEFESSGIVPLCDDHCENALSQLVGLPRRVVPLENGSHRQSVFCNHEATVEDGLQLRGQQPK